MTRKPKPLAPAPMPAGSAPAPFSLAQAAAIQALSRFEADAEQQKIAFEWILRDACGIGLWPYRESARETDIALGRQFVGQQIMGAVNVKLSHLQQQGRENA